LPPAPVQVHAYTPGENGGYDRNAIRGVVEFNP